MEEHLLQRSVIIMTMDDLLIFFARHVQFVGGLEDALCLLAAGVEQDDSRVFVDRLQLTLNGSKRGVEIS